MFGQGKGAQDLGFEGGGLRGLTGLPGTPGCPGGSGFGGKGRFAGLDKPAWEDDQRLNGDRFAGFLQKEGAQAPGCLLGLGQGLAIGFGGEMQHALGDLDHRRGVSAIMLLGAGTQVGLDQENALRADGDMAGRSIRLCRPIRAG
jgi:hypothetical protein